MVKVYVTGDNHFGRKYARYPDVRDKLIQSRFDSLRAMVRQADKENCELFVVTGDLFDNNSTVKAADVKKAAEILSEFSGTVAVLPGNHDYYTGDNKVWNDFEAAISDNTLLLKEYKVYPTEIGGETVKLYPAFCQSKHSKENNLEWIKAEDLQTEGCINIGIAHGAIKGVTPDMKEEYFLMTEQELNDIPVDVWLIGHTHIQFPDCLKENEETVGYKIFNAGTHEQLDLHNNTEGCGFIISISKNGSAVRVSAKKHISGSIRFYDIDITVKPDSDDALERKISQAIKGLDRQAIIRLNISGIVRSEEYLNKVQLYKQLLGDFLSYEISDSELSEEITIDKIQAEYAETSFAAQFMEALINNPAELQMAYQLLQSCRE